MQDWMGKEQQHNSVPNKLEAATMKQLSQLTASFVWLCGYNLIRKSNGMYMYIIYYKTDMDTLNNHTPDW